MKHFFKSATLSLAIVFVPMLILVRFMETSQRFDALGWWYSIFVTVVFSIPTALVIAAGYFFFTKARGGSA